WSKEFAFIAKSRKGDHHVFCSLCSCDIDISNCGKGDLNRHISSEKHKLNSRSATTSTNIQTFFKTHDKNVTAAELCKVFHAIKHHHSYRSIDCSVKVDKTIYRGSSVAKDLTCGKTKAEALSVNVLAPYSIQKHLDYIKANDLYFSLATDASNKGSTKCFPLVLRYFNFEEGIQHFLLDFYSDSHESSQTVAMEIFEKLKDFDF
uniref:Uncharacterized protein n=1 Tax=Latimeria chalumnae TaxID=7897 RepID=H3ABK6_LATCH